MPHFRCSPGCRSSVTLQHMPTYYDQSVRLASESWRSIRKRRAAPPGLAQGHRARGQTFQASLEQAEQQFRSAARIGYESRPLNLFYGLSQAGRAIAAASPRCPGGDWQLSGHGISCPNLNERWSSVTHLKVRADGVNHSSFTRVSKALDSPVPAEAFDLSLVLPQMLEATIHSPLGQPLNSAILLSHFPDRLMIAEHGRDSLFLEIPRRVSNLDPSARGNFDTYLKRFPGLRGAVSNIGVPTENGWPLTEMSAHLFWDLSQSESLNPHVVRTRSTLYRSHRILLPTAPGVEGNFHPLMIWWICLYVLSMAARYSPDQWTKCIDVNRSPEATSVEYLLDVAIDAVPDLINEAIDCATQSCT